jgi:hypothetical protein
MQPHYQTLQNHLQQRLAIIADTALREADPAAQLAALQAASEAIEAWRAEHEASCPARLRHFLQQSSLQKALEFIQTMPAQS